VAALAGGDPRLTQPVAVVGLLEDLPLLIVHGERDATVRPRDVRRLAAKAPGGTRAVTIAGADHGGGHAADSDAYEAAVTGLLRDAFRAARG
jgi:pimeloyl-ACP methyl ester carboxylesterase